MYRGRLIPGDFYFSTPYESRVDRLETLSPKRIACMFVADFAVAAIARTNPELREQPFALTRMPAARRSGNSGYCGRKPAEYQPHSELSNVSPAARVAGLRPAMTVAQARALLPDLFLTHPSPAAERSSMDALLDVAESISPVVEEGAPGCVWLDLAGVERLYRYSMQTDGSIEEVEKSIAGELIGRARRIGLDASAAIGSSKEIANLAARCGGARVIAPGQEREFLDWLPLDLIELDPDGRGDEIELMLKRLGIRRLGDIARLDIHAIGSRLGRRGVELARLARGEGSATIVARARVETFAEVAEFEFGIENLEPLGFVLHAMLRQLAERLQMRGFAAGNMTLSLGLADHRRHDRQVVVAAATNEARSLLTLLKLNLEKSPPPAAVETIRLTIEPRTLRPAQNDLFLPPAPAPDRLEAAIARIASLCGPDRVGMLMPADSHRPEAVRVGKFAPPPPAPADTKRECTASQLFDMVEKGSHKSTPTPSHCALSKNGRGNNLNSTPIVLRTIRPAEEVEVICRRNAPEFVRGNNICAQVVSAAGPWRRQGEWWAAATSSNLWQAHVPTGYMRDYYELALSDGAVYRVYCDLSAGKWFVDGIYD